MNQDLFHNENITIKKFIESKGRKILNGKNTYRKISCVESKSFGNELRFQLPRLSKQLLKNVKLRVDLSALSGGSGGSYNRFVNNILLRLFSKFELWSGGQMVLQYYPDEITYANILPNVHYEKWVKMATDIGWQETAATRNTYAAAVQNLVIDLKYIFDIFSIPYPIHLLHDEQNAIELRFLLTSALSDVVQTDHSTKPSVTVNDVFLECTYVKNDLIADYYRKVQRELTLKGGYQVYSHFYLRRNHPVAASASLVADVDIRQFQKNSVCKIVTLVRDTADKSTAWTNDFDDDLKSVTDFQIRDGSDNLYYKESQITELEYRKYILDQFNYRGINNIYNRNSYHLYFGEDAEDEFAHELRTFNGGMNMNFYNDLRYYVTLASTSTSKDIDIIAVTMKRIGIINGQIKVLH